jgi:hypothetical protein
MKKHILYSGSILFSSLMIAGVLVFARHAAQSQSDNGQQLKELKARIGHLETEAARLQKELDRVHKQTSTVIYMPANELISPASTSSAPPQIPPGWKPYEFNGLTYYFTPLGQGTEVSMTPAK